MRARFITLTGCLLAVAVGTVAFADAGSGKSDKDQSSAMDEIVVADAGPMPDRGPGAPPPPPMGGRHGPHGPHGFFGHPPIAAILSEQETVIGVRSNQLDAWRDYSDAIQAMMAPPSPPPVEALASADAFAMPKAMADDVAKRADAAKKVQVAIEALKKTLTPEQLERAARFGQPQPPPGPHPRGDEMGPGQASPR